MLDDNLAGGLVDLPDDAVGEWSGLGGGRLRHAMIMLGEDGQAQGKEEREKQAHGVFHPGEMP